MKKKYIVHLSKEERQLLKALVSKGKVAAYLPAAGRPSHSCPGAAMGR